MAMTAPSTMVMSAPPGPAGFSTPPSSSSSSNSSSSSSYVVNSKIMVVAVAVLFAVVLFILCLHIYAKWFWRNQGSVAAAGPGTLSWRIRRRYRDDPNAQNFNQAFVNLQSVGLEQSVVEALPTFEYKPSETNSKLECVVCLEEFEDGEKGRTLPKCGHNFHLDCIDMWLHSHSTCPLCRASVQPPDADSMEKVVPPASSSAASAVVIAITTESTNSTPSETVVGDVRAPFMAAMRASRRRRGLGLGSPLSPAGTNSLPRTAEDHQDAQDAGTDSSTQGGEHHQHQQQSRGLGNESSATQTPSGADLKLNVAKTSSKIPSNVLFWGNQTQVNTSAGSINASRSSSLRAPFQVAIDIPRASNSGAAASSDSGSSSPFTNLMSPMVRASASFRRLLSQGRNVAVSPHTPSSPEDAAAGSSSSLPPPNA